MENRIVWSKDVADELIEIITYIKNHVSAKKSAEIYTRIKSEIETTRLISEGGRVVPDLSTIGITEIKEIIDNPRQIFYKTVVSEILILTIIDARRNLEDILYKKILAGKLM